MRTKYCAICGKEFGDIRILAHDCLVLEFNSKDQITDKKWFSVHDVCYKELFIANTKED